MGDVQTAEKSAAAARGALGAAGVGVDAPAATDVHAGAPKSSGVRAGALAHSALKRVQHLAYSHVDARDEWLRGPSRAFVEDVLLSSRVAEHGVLEPAAVRTLVAEHMAGAGHANAIGLLLTVELWQRYFEDGERPAAKET
jgi:hypothetical protein